MNRDIPLNTENPTIGTEIKPIEVLESKQRLLDAAIEVFAQKGFDAASIREICRKANVNIASVNYYFRDKERLYIEACLHAHVISCGNGQSHLAIDLTQPPVEHLKQFIRELTSRMHAPADANCLQLLMRELSNPSIAAKEVVQEFIQPMAFQLRAILEKMLPGLDYHRSLMIGFSIIGQILYYRQNRKVSELIFGSGGIDQLSLGDVTEHITRFTLASLGYAEPIKA